MMFRLQITMTMPRLHEVNQRLQNLPHQDAHIVFVKAFDSSHRLVEFRPHL